MASARRSATGAAITPNFPREVTEAALAHAVGDKAEQAGAATRSKSGVG
jgi:hypothetical protein